MVRLGVAVALVLAFATLAGAQDYYPMCIGSQWEYEGLNSGDVYVSRCARIENIWGIDCAVFSHHSSGDKGLENYWYKDSEGGTRIRGFYRSIEGFGVLYDPGILTISANPFLGELWCTEVDIYDLPDTTHSGHWAMCFSVQEEAFLDLPDGIFYAYGVGGVMPPEPRSGYDLAGRRCDSMSRNATEWYSESVGVVQFRASDTYQIAHYALPPSRIEGTTWGRVKTLFLTCP